MTCPSPSVKYLSLFSGIGGFEHGLLRVKPDAVCVGFSEIAPCASLVYQRQWPKARSYGDVRGITRWSVLQNHCEACRQKDAPCDTHADVESPAVDLLFGGSPCQDFSTARNGERQGIDGPKSGLMHEFFRLVKELKPKVFVLENINTISDRDILKIGRTLRCGCVQVDACHFTSQSRPRLFWTNASARIPPVMRVGPAFESMLDEELSPKEILNERELSKLYTRLHLRKYKRSRRSKGGIMPHECRITNLFTGLSYSFKHRSTTLMRSSMNRTTNMLIYDERLAEKDMGYCKETGCRLPWRRMSVAECHRLQGFAISQTARNDEEAMDERLNRRERVGMLGDAVCVDVAEYLFRYIYNDDARDYGQLSVSRMFQRRLASVDTS
ncbi:hypothetical protein CYMTET_52251 [Cymbomonas tetramitiformis]|uniref:Cytosine-specific methyltransferase n=1 Tax=Cymbomonas tetramitiformis TaxID=36881 RepID=A0AAE0BKN9_9CHLO|nr:hypothetical protein CYMTET_52251 [Cymbomonas tetramitiformis]